MGIIRKLLATIIVNAIAPFGVAYILGDHFIIEPIWGYAVVGAVIGFANAVIKPLLSLLTLPLVLVTFGLFLVLINAFLLYAIEILFQEILAPIGVTFSIEGGVIYYFAAAILLSFINGIVHFIFKK